MTHTRIRPVPKALLAILLLVLMIAAGSCSGGGDPIIPGAPDTQLRNLSETFVTSHSAVLSESTVVLRGVVTATSLASDLVDVVAGFVVVDWDPLVEFSYVNDQTLQDAAELAQFNTDAESYIGALLSEGDSLFDVGWNPTGGQSFSTIAIVAPDGTVLYEPVLDMELAVEDVVVKFPQWAEDGTRLSQAEGTTQHIWKNVLGVTKAWAQIVCGTLGANGCTASFTGSFTSGSAFPYVVEPATGSPTPVVWCFPKPYCECRASTTGNEEMECATATQSYAVIARIGTAWFGADLTTTSATIQSWACADGQAGVGSGQ